MIQMKFYYKQYKKILSLINSFIFMKGEHFMVSMTYLNLNFDSYEVKIIRDLKITHTVNEHSYMKVTAVLNQKNQHNPAIETKPGSKVELLNTKGDIKVLFKGITTYIQIKNLENVYYMELEALSSTFLLDVKKCKRSFQDDNLSYHDVIKNIIGSYEKSDFIDYTTNEIKIEKFIMQYDETDWEFIKRIASHFNAGLVPSIVSDYPKFIIGKPIGTNRGKLNKFNFSIDKDIIGFMKSVKNGNTQIKDLDKVDFTIQTFEEFEIGDEINYLNIKLYIKSIFAEIANGSLIYTYKISLLNGLLQDKFYNEKIVGLSLKGKVIDTVNDKLKVHLEIDTAQDKEKAWLFPYTTIYTAEGNSGWYCMPELEDTVIIFFPTKQEEQAIGMNSIRQLDKDTAKINSPEIKYFRTKDGKELKFSPEEIVITCCNTENEKTGEKDIIYFKLNEKTGIEIKSTKPITINTDSNLTLESKKKIKVSAKDGILLNCKGSEMKIGSSINISSTSVSIN